MNIFVEIKKLKKSEAGNFTLEASLLFPIILMLTISLVFFSLIIYEKVVIHHRAQLIADRMAYVWNNSSRDPVTGAFSVYTSDTSSDDGLYWRLFGNNFLSKFGLHFGGSDALINKKISRAQKRWLPKNSEEQIQFKNTVAGGYIKVRIKEPLHLPSSIEKLFGIHHVETTAKSSINDPVEFIRNTDFVYHYAQQLLKNTGRSPITAISLFKK